MTPSRLCPPPKDFRPAEGVQDVHIYFNYTPPFIAAKKRHYTGRRLQGKKYEQKGHDYIRGLIRNTDYSYQANPWLHFAQNGSGYRWCQPDGCIFNGAKTKLILLEFKYQHTSDAWYQLFRLYKPVLEVCYPQTVVSCCEVVKWFDPAVNSPQEPKLCHDVLNAGPDDFHVHIWKP